MRHTTNKRRRIFLLSIVIIMVLAVGGYFWHAADTSSISMAATSNTASTATLAETSDGIDWTKLPTKTVTLTNSRLNITEAGTYTLTGSSTAGVTVNSDGNVRLILDGVTIKSANDAAIQVISAKNTVIQLKDGTTSTISDAATRSDQAIDGAIYSADDLIFNGNGTLNITSNFQDAIVSNDDLTISSGTYNIKSADDGIRGKDSVTIASGVLTVTATGDGIKSTNDAEQTKGNVQILGGMLTISAGDNAIQAQEKAVVKAGTINIKTSSEGIEGANVEIDGGDVTLYASDDGINARATTFTTTPVITFNGGTINITVGSGDTDAIDSNGDVVVNGGTINITAPTSSFDYDGTAKMTGGNITINGEKVSSIPEPTMGGGGFRR